MKYIMFRCRNETMDMTMLLPVLFPDVINHKDISEAVEHVKVQPLGPFSDWWMWPKAVNAGFYRDGICSGDSDSLKMRAHPDDSAIVNAFLKGECHPSALKERL
jgi:hypothetical protein